VTFRWCALALLLAASACGGDGGADGEATSPTVATSVGAAEPVGFDTISVTVTEPDGDARSMCLHLADTPELRSRGLMGVTDLGGRDGMLFRYDGPHDGRFWMKNTLLPLSIAFYAEDGAFVSATDMDPCPPDTDCPYYSADAPYTAAIEVPQGALGALGLVPGSSLAVGSSPCG
jgi:uncharacterized membrane protein (UPF0127 family)